MSDKMFALIEVSKDESVHFFDRLDVMCDNENLESPKIVWQSEILELTISNE